MKEEETKKKKTAGRIGAKSLRRHLLSAANFIGSRFYGKAQIGVMGPILGRMGFIFTGPYLQHIFGNKPNYDNTPIRSHTLNYQNPTNQNNIILYEFKNQTLFNKILNYIY